MKFTKEDIEKLSKIGIKEVESNCIMENEYLKFKPSFILKLDLSDEGMKILNDFKFKGAFIDWSKALNKSSIEKEIEFKGWVIYPESPRHWYEWAAGVWRLHFNNKMSEDMAYGAATTQEIADAIREAIGENPFGGIVIEVSVIVEFIMTLGEAGIESANINHNGILIRFLSWLLPTASCKRFW